MRTSISCFFVIGIIVTRVGCENHGAPKVRGSTSKGVEKPKQGSFSQKITDVAMEVAKGNTKLSLFGDININFANNLDIRGPKFGPKDAARLISILNPFTAMKKVADFTVNTYDTMVTKPVKATMGIAGQLFDAVMGKPERMIHNGTAEITKNALTGVLEKSFRQRLPSMIAGNPTPNKKAKQSKSFFFF